MVIIGIGDGLDAGAALVIDGELVAVENQAQHDRRARSADFPWAAIDAVLNEAGLRRKHVDEVAVGGKFSPPLFARRRPWARRLVRSPFSPVFDAQAMVQTVLKQSGLGALEGERASKWFADRFNRHGFEVSRVIMLDTHRALAEAAYRSQPKDDAPVLVVTLHPLGDGVGFAVHKGSSGQMERVWSQGFASLYLHLRRCAYALGFEQEGEEARLWPLAAAGEPDGGLVELLNKELHAEGPSLSGRSPRWPSRREAPLYKALRNVDTRDAAASVLHNLSRTVQSVVQWHVEETGVRHVALAGTIFDNPRLVAEIAALDQVESLWAPPGTGHGWLPVGAALGRAGVAPFELPLGLGRSFTDRQYERALAVGGLEGARPADAAEAAAAFLAEGHGVARFVGRGGFGHHGGGTRSVLVRADEPDAVERVRTALHKSALSEPVCLWAPVPGQGHVRDEEVLASVFRFGAAAPPVDTVFASRHGGVVTADGRVQLQRVSEATDPELHRTLLALHRRTGCAAVGCFALSKGTDPYVSVPGDALRAWRRSELPALLLGPFLVQGEEEAP